MSELRRQSCGHHIQAEVTLASRVRAYNMVQLAKGCGVEVYLLDNTDPRNQVRAATLYASANYDLTGPEDPGIPVREALNIQECGGFVVGLVAQAYPGCAVALMDQFTDSVDQLTRRIN